MASDDYIKAQKLAKNAYRRAASRGEYPYLPALDEFVSQVDIRTEENLGIVNIPLSQIVGTKTAGRQSSFAVNFMPLMPENSEFARKWDAVVEYHMNQGVGDPIVAYEFMNRFYVLEGNKRVSVLKYFQADSIEGSVTRIIPYPENTRENKIYYEFLEFYRDSQINYVWFTQEGSFDKLTEAVGKQKGEKWTDDEKMDFKSFFNRFTDIFEAKGGASLKATSSDALLFYLSLYPYEDVRNKTQAEMKADVDRIWDQFPLLGSSATDSSVVLDPSQEIGSGNVFTRFFKSTSSKQLKVSFIHDRTAEDSSWTYGHELGRMSLAQIFGDKISTNAVFFSDESSDISELIEQEIEAGNHLIFTTSQKFLPASLKAAIEHPEVKILNCSVGQPYSALRTYYGRLYEAKFLSGLIAGAMTPNDKVAYIAPFPLYGTMANINAFALGVRMTNPDASVYLHWAAQTDAEPFEELIERENISVISDNDMIRPASENRLFGLYMKKDDTYLKLAAPIWNWGKFYERIIRDFLQGNWEKTDDVRHRQAVNYWWGISGGIIDLITSSYLPHGIDYLTEVMKQQICSNYYNPFMGEVTLQGGRTVGTKGKVMTPEEVITQDYLVRAVIGSIPKAEQLKPDARVLLEMQNHVTPAATTI